METINIETAVREMSVTKTLSAPVNKVWEVWTNPEHIVNWWGPNGFTSAIHAMNVTPGGEWRLTMYGPDGKSYVNRSMFINIEPMEKIVFHHFNPNYLATVTFQAKGNETVMEWTNQFESAELFETVVKVFKADEGLKQNAEKLEDYLKQISL
ncbi:MAG TPA: SRPBCC domain-containing protein [Ignavibacteriales bacterium]|nr:SRPBCC domain-containing protein [Ignavibacteriales bacterium]